MQILTKWGPWVLALYIVFVFGQSLFFKFSSAPDSIYIFQTIEDWLGLGFFEPAMRYVIGVTELFALILLLIPGKQAYGAVLALGVITGALFFHIASPLGIATTLPSVGAPDPTLFIMACGVFVSALIILAVRRKQLPI